MPATAPALSESPGDDTALARIVAESLRVRCENAGDREVEPGYSTGWRRLPTTVAAQLRRGIAQLEIDGEPTRAIRPGEATCLPRGVLHRYTHPEGGRAVFAHADLAVLGGLDALALLGTPPVLSGAAADAVGDACAALVRATALPATLPTLCARHEAGARLLGALAGAAEPSARSLETLRVAQRLTPAIEAAGADPGISVAQLARRARLSPSRLHALFRTAFGCAPMAWVQRHRLERARALLASTSLTIAVVAEQSGFGDPFHFSRAFKRAHGQSPAAYRESLARMVF